MKISDIAIIVNSHEEGINLRNFITRKFKNKIRIMEIFTNFESFERKVKKRRFRINSPYLKMSTIQSFKGWEARNVIILIPRDSKNLDIKTSIANGISAFSMCLAPVQVQ